VIFDEAHSEAWTIRPELAGQMQPVHPADASYARAADLLSGHSFSVAANTEPLDGGVLDGCDLLVIAHPSDPRWESTTGIGSPQLTAAERDAVDEFVHAGGGLIVLGETEQDKYGNNVNELLARFELRLRSDTVQDYEHCDGAPTWIRGELVDGGRGSGGDLLAGVSAACFYRTTTIESRNGARVLARTYRSASVPGEPLIVASEHGDGRVVVLGDSDLFGDDCIGSLDHSALWLNLVNWASRRLASSPGRSAAGAAASDSRDVPATGVGVLIEATNALAAGGRRPWRGGGTCRGRRLCVVRLDWRFPEFECGGGGPASLGRRGIRQARLQRFAGRLPSRAGTRGRPPAPGVLPDVQAERLARHLL